MSSDAILFIVVIVSLVTSEKVGLEETCATEDFENGLENFDDSTGLCTSAPGVWEVGYYVDTNIQPPHRSSKTFITQLKANQFSCTTSFDFQARATGIVEVIFYMSVGSAQEFLHVIVNQRLANGNLVQANSVSFLMNNINNHDWNILRIEVGSTGTYNGSVSNLVLYSYNSTVENSNQVTITT